MLSIKPCKMPVRFFGFTILVVLIFCLPSAAAKPHFTYDDQVKEIYKLATQLKLDQAVSKLNAYSAKYPDNLATLHVANYIDFFKLFINEDYSEFEVLIKNKHERLKIIEQANVDSPYSNYVRGEILLQWALIRSKFDEKLTAGREIYEAYKLLEANKKKYPDFVENNKSLSLMHILAESLPSWVRKIIGVKGSIREGVKEIESLVKISKDADFMFREEVACIYAYVLFYQLNEKTKAVRVFDDFKLDHKSNPLIAFLKSSIYLRAGDNESALKFLSEAPRSSEYYPFLYLDFMLGKCKMYKLEPDASKHILKFTNGFNGRHYIKEAYQKLAWGELISGNVAGYRKYMDQVISKGYALVDEDKQALIEAKSGSTPNSILLRARISYDGGYYSKAYAELTRNTHEFFNKPKLQLEFNYRMGRTLQSMNNNAEAITYFNLAMSQGTKSREYYACASALQMGMIYEELGQKQSAIKQYKTCLAMKPDEYQTSLHQKAKSGLQRLEK